MTELTKAFLVLWTVRSGLMSYENMVQVAKDNNLTKDQIPHLRTANNAFAKAKDSLKGMPMDTLLELEGWDGQVKQHLDVKNLLRGNEYQVSIVREGIMNGKLHKESIPVVRLKFSPPSDFNANAWVKNYVRSFWDEKYIAKIESGKKKPHRFQRYRNASPKNHIGRIRGRSDVDHEHQEQSNASIPNIRHWRRPRNAEGSVPQSSNTRPQRH